MSDLEYCNQYGTAVEPLCEGLCGGCRSARDEKRYLTGKLHTRIECSILVVIKLFSK